MKKNRDAKYVEHSLRNLLLDNFFRYHTDKLGTVEFIIRFLRIDIPYKEQRPKSKELLEIVRLWHRGYVTIDDIRELAGRPVEVEEEIPHKRGFLEKIREWIRNRLS